MLKPSFRPSPIPQPLCSELLWTGVQLAEVLKPLACLSFLLIARGGPTGMLHELREGIWGGES